MAVDIGPRIGIDGEKAFRDSINAINGEIKKFSAEMKALSLEMDNTDDKECVLARQNEVLRQSISSTQKSLDVMTKEAEKQADALRKLGEELDKATSEYGENSDEAVRAQNAYNKQYKELTKLQTNIAKTTGDMNKLQSELRQNENAMNGLDGETGKLADSFDDAGKSAAGFGDILSANLISDAITGAISGIVSGLKQVSEESREFRKIMGSLEISSEKAGYSAAETEAAYNSLYGVLADNQTAATTTANLQALGLEQEQLNQIINGTIGAWATYGDSIPIDGLAEAINETAQVGTVTGTFADVLNWAGTSEDEFNEKLANCSTESERANLILQELANQGLIAAGEGWQQNNASLVAANQATADYEATMAELGEIVEPVLTAIQTGINTLLGLLVSLLQTVNFEAIVAGITEIITFFTDLVAQVQSGSLSIGEAFSAILSKLGEIVTNGLSLLSQSLPQFLAQGSDIVTQIVSGIVSELPSILSAAGKIISGFLNSVLSAQPQILSSGAEMLVNLVQGIIGNLPEIVASATSVIASFLATIVSNLPQILESGINILGQLVAGIIQAIPEIIAAVPKVVSAFWNEITKVNWGELGANILKGLANGVLGAVGRVVDAAKEAAGRIASAFKDFFDINSPSRYMEEMIGRNIMLGWAEGLSEYSATAVKAARSASADIMGAFPSKIEVPVQANGTALAYDRMATQLSGLQVVLDDGTLVGKLSPKINNALGGYARREGRFGT